MTSGQARFPVALSRFEFDHTARQVQRSASCCRTPPASPIASPSSNRCSPKRSIDPAMTFMQTGSQQPGRPSSFLAQLRPRFDDSSLPAFMVMQATWTGRRSAQALFERLWGAGMLPSEYQGVSLRSIGDPVLYLSDPPGVERTTRRQMLDSLARLNGKVVDAWRSGNGGAHRPVRDGVPDADLRTGVGRHPG